LTAVRTIGCVAAVVCALFQASCMKLDYVTQAAVGENDLLVRARDIDALLRDGRVSGRMGRLLSQVATIKRFGEAHGLTATKNYTQYVRVDRPVAVWVVSASEPLRFQSRSWSFPLVGSFTYLGWFHRDAADAYGAKLRAEGLDVDVRGAGAYSTTGYFDDPVVSTMIAPGPEALGELANVILHESAHATFFVRNQSTLNESVANFVGDTLGAAYVEDTLGHDAKETVAYETHERWRAKTGAAFREAFVALEALYSSDRSDAEKLEVKRGILDRLRVQVHASRPINNATLIQFRTYNSGQGELATLLTTCAGDWPRFMRSLRTLESSSFAKAQESDVGALVRPLIDSRCAG
jgi:predicted aminopeptidase